MTDDEIIAVVQAHKEGKKIERKWNSNSGLADWPMMAWHEDENPTWEFSYWDYRVATEPRKPREYWLELAKDGSVDSACREHEVKSIRGGELVLVREVI